MLLHALLCVASLQSTSTPLVYVLPPGVQERTEPLRGLGYVVQRRGRLGVAIADAEHGVAVRTVEPDSPAERAGLRPGDRIVVLGGIETPNAAALIEAVREKGAGASVGVIVERDFEVEVQNLKSDGGDLRPRLGVLLGMREDGVHATEVEDGGPARRAGIRAGDRLLSVDATPTPDVQAMLAKVATLSAGQVVKLTVARELEARLGEAKEPEAAAPFLFEAPVPRAPARAAERAAVPDAPAAPRAEAGRRTSGAGAIDTRELTAAMRELRAELVELRRELADLRREIAADRRTR